jgi:hypothetical protein
VIIRARADIQFRRHCRRCRVSFAVVKSLHGRFGAFEIRSVGRVDGRGNGAAATVVVVVTRHSRPSALSSSLSFVVVTRYHAPPLFDRRCCHHCHRDRCSDDDYDEDGFLIDSSSPQPFGFSK